MGGCPAAGFGPAGSARPAENAGAGRLAGTPGGSIDAFGAFRRASRLTAIDCGISSRISTEPCGRDGGRAAKCKRRAGTFPARRAATGIARIGTEACEAHGLAVVRGNCAARVSRSDDPSEPAGWPTSACIHAENGLAVAAIKAEREEWGVANFSFSCAARSMMRRSAFMAASPRMVFRIRGTRDAGMRRRCGQTMPRVPRRATYVRKPVLGADRSGPDRSGDAANAGASNRC